MRNLENSKKQRAVVAVQVAVASTALIGLAALGVDVGLMYAAKADLQKVADAAALAAASQLGNFAEAETKETTVVALADAAATAVLTDNDVLGQDISLDAGDIEYGYSIWNDGTQRFEFQAAAVEGSGGVNGVNAVRITTRRTSDSSNGAVDLAFGGVFGFGEANITASATAILVPRDIIVLADLSGSYNDDSQLQNYALNDPNGINLLEVWKTLPKSSADGALLQAWLDANPGMTVADAPSTFFETDYGFFGELGSSSAGSIPVFGETLINSSYNPAGDDGLVRLRRGRQWSSGEIGSPNYTNMRMFLVGQGYSIEERDLIMANTSSSTTNGYIKDADYNSVSFSSEFSDKDRYDLRVAAALGLVFWSSGRTDGLWQDLGLPPGDGDFYIEPNEVHEAVAYPFPQGNWFEYVQYMRDANNSNRAYDKLKAIKYRFGAKTFVNFLLEEKEMNSETDVSHYAYANPLHLTKNSLDVLMDDLVALDSADRIGLVTYGTTAVVDYPLPDETVELSENAADIKALYRARQAAHYSPATNIGQGIEMATGQLIPGGSTNARPEATKVIVLLTDGMANIDGNGDFDGTGEAGVSYALAAAQDAWEQHRVKIHAIGVGAAADIDTLDEIAEHGRTGEAYWATGDFSEIQSELTNIFQKIGGLRPIQIID